MQSDGQDVTPQDGFAEAYRGAVGAWECDAFDHLNIAFYGERFADAAFDRIERIAPGTRWRTSALDIRYRRELRAGEVMTIASAVLGSEPGGVLIAHRATNATGECTTLAEQRLLGTGGEAMPVTAAAEWDRFEPLDLPSGDSPLITCRNRVRARDMEEGTLALEACVRRFSDACLAFLDAVGMTEPYRRDADRGFATVETRLLLTEATIRPDRGVVVTSGAVGIGASSLRLLHHMRDASDGKMLARFYQAGVNFDLAARRAAPWPPEFRAKAESLRIR